MHIYYNVISSSAWFQKAITPPEKYVLLDILNEELL